MDNHIYVGGPHSQPNGILPRPASQSRRPQQQQPTLGVRPQQMQRQVEPASFQDEDDDDFGTDDPEFNTEPLLPPPSIPSRSKNNRELELPRSSSKDKDKEFGNAEATPKFLKIAIIGDSAAGKTCLCNAITLESYTFDRNYHLTCGVNVYSKSVKVPDQISSQIDPTTSAERLNMALLDSSGKDIYLDYLPKYWDKLDGFVLVVDLTSPTCLTTAEEWLKLALSCCRRTAGGNQYIGILVGNKMDLSERRKISSQIAAEFATKHNLQYFECSVKENSGLEEPFFFLAHKYNTSLSMSTSEDKENLDKRNI